MTKDMTLQEVFDVSKEAFDGEKDMYFVLEVDEGLEVVTITGEPEDKIEALSQMVKDNGCERYYVVFCGFAVKKEDVADYILRLHKLVENESDFKELLAHISLINTLPPSKHPCRKNVFNVVRCDKREGTDAIGESYKVVENVPVFTGNTYTTDGSKSIYMKFNVWSPLQVTLGEVQDEE